MMDKIYVYSFTLRKFLIWYVGLYITDRSYSIINMRATGKYIPTWPYQLIWLMEWSIVIISKAHISIA